jgi:ABC-type transport system involved in cytochrome bd biosynthesis fused ATPase/permease subunit
MSVNRIPLLISMLYAIAVVFCAMVWQDALAVVATVGAMVVGLAWVFLRPEAGAGRERNRNRNRA